MRSSLSGIGEAPEAALAATAGLGLSACLFTSIRDIAPDLDAGRLDEIAAEARHLGVAIHAGIGWINGGQPGRMAEAARLGGGDAAVGLVRMATAAARIGVRDMFFVIGTLEDRDDASVPWAEQLAATARLISGLAPTLRDLGVRLLVKTHEEITSTEILRLIEVVGTDVLGVALDPVNFVVRAEDPERATARLGCHVGQVHLDDFVMRFEGDGARRYLCDVGAGALDWSRLLDLVTPGAPVWIDLHKGQFATPLFDLGWVAAQADVTALDVASIAGMARAWADRPVPRDQARPADRLPAAIAAARQLKR